MEILFLASGFGCGVLIVVITLLLCFKCTADYSLDGKKFEDFATVGKSSIVPNGIIVRKIDAVELE